MFVQWCSTTCLYTVKKKLVGLVITVSSNVVGEIEYTNQSILQLLKFDKGMDKGSRNLPHFRYFLHGSTKFKVNMTMNGWRFSTHIVGGWTLLV